MTRRFRAFCSQGDPLPIVVVYIIDGGRSPLQGLVLRLSLLRRPDQIEKTRGEAENYQQDHEPGRGSELPVQHPSEPASETDADNEFSGVAESLPEGHLARLNFRLLGFSLLCLDSIKLLTEILRPLANGRTVLWADFTMSRGLTLAVGRHG